jgi:hypothetical protein
MIDHSEILPRLAAYHDGALPDEERATIRQHLDLCAECRTRLDEWSALDSALRALTTPEPAETGMAAAALLRIESNRRVEHTPASGGPAPFRWRVWAGAAAAAVVLAASIAMWRSGARENAGSSDLALAPSERAERGATAPATPVITDEAGDVQGAPAAAADSIGERAQVPDSGATSYSNVKSVESERMTTRTAARDPEPNVLATAPTSILSEDSGIPQDSDWQARLAFVVDIHYRFYDRIDAAYVELNIVPLFEVEFAPVSYARYDPLSGQWDAGNPEPTLLSPEDTYLVSNLRLERSTLLALVTNQAPTSAVRFRLAEVTWRLAQMTADQDDVRSAISAQSEVLRQDPEVGTQSRARLAYLRGLVR